MCDVKRKPPLWLIVTGPPASGKTTLARRLARDLNMPLYEMDVFKDTLFQILGVGDKDWSQQVGRSAIGLLFVVANQALGSGASLVTECNFVTRLSSERVGEIAANARARVVQVHCSASPELLVERNAARLAPPNMRPGHYVMTSQEMLEGVRSGVWEPLDVHSKIVRVDTSGSFNYASVLGDIAQDAPHPIRGR